MKSNPVYQNIWVGVAPVTQCSLNDIMEVSSSMNLTRFWDIIIGYLSVMPILMNQINCICGLL